MGYKPKPQETTQEMLKKPLAPIAEEWTSNDMALVPVTYENQKKQRNELLKAKAKLVSQGQKTGKRVLYDEDVFNPQTEKTFVTGGGLPGRGRKA